jgi:uncharacterized heparinase superfamily protein
VDYIDAVLQNTFKFNNEIHCFGSTLNWLNNPSEDIEWHIMLHKGYYLVGLMKLFSATGNSKYLQKWIELTDSWIEQINNPGFIATDVTGRRIQNWIYSFYYLIDSNNSKHPVVNDFLMGFLASLESQVNFVIDNLSPSRNHRTLGLHAIFLAAVAFPEFRRSGDWLVFSLQALADNAAKDILTDGVHCELSTFYHHIVLKNLLAVKRLATANHIHMPTRFDAAVRRALDFALFVHKPDGQIPSLSDGDTGSFYDLLEQGYDFYGVEQLRYVFTQGEKGAPPVNKVKAFPNSGYIVLRSAWANNSESFQDARYLVFDCGSLGAGNHGHLDLLNIEVAAYGRSLIVDPGRYTYDESGATNWRVLFRSTRYHNTVEVDGKNQTNYRYSERKGKYKILGPHAQAELSCLLSGNACHLLRGVAHSHEYTALHERKIFFANDEYWLIWDILKDEQTHQYALRFHLAPEAQERTQIARKDHIIIVDTPGLLLLQPIARQTEVFLEAGFVSSEYGNKAQAPIINFQRQTNNTVFTSILFPYKQRHPDIILQTITAEIPDPQQPAWAASAFSVQIESGNDKLLDFFFIAHDNNPRQWRYDHIECTGCFCYLRINSAGQVENFFTGPDSHIKFEGQELQMQAKIS